MDRFTPARNAETGFVLAFDAGVDKLVVCTYSILRRMHNVSGDRAMHLYQHQLLLLVFRLIRTTILTVCVCRYS